jgi:molecular chaperone GrpE (heat shock protein)
MINYQIGFQVIYKNLHKSKKINHILYMLNGQKFDGQLNSALKIKTHSKKINKRIIEFP